MATDEECETRVSRTGFQALGTTAIEVGGVL